MSWASSWIGIHSGFTQVQFLNATNWKSAPTTCTQGCYRRLEKGFLVNKNRFRQLGSDNNIHKIPQLLPEYLNLHSIANIQVTMDAMYPCMVLVSKLDLILPGLKNFHFLYNPIISRPLNYTCNYWVFSPWFRVQLYNKVFIPLSLVLECYAFIATKLIIIKLCKKPDKITTTCFFILSFPSLIYQSIIVEYKTRRKTETKIATESSIQV